MARLFIGLHFFILFSCFSGSYINTLGLPAPSIFSMSPTSVSTNPTPAFRITNSKIGSTLKIYGGVNCTQFLEEVIVNADDFQYVLQNHLADGVYQFTALYVTNGKTSNCSEPIPNYYYDPHFSTVRMKSNIKNVAETNSTIYVDVEITPAKSYDVTVKFNFTGSNVNVNTSFASAARSVMIPAGATEAQIPIQLINDGVKNIDGMININIESANYSQVRISADQPSMRIYVEDALASFSAVTDLQFSVNGSCLLRANGSVKCFGDLLGNGSGGWSGGVMTFDSGVQYSKIAAETGTKCGISTLGTLKCFGVAIGDGIGAATLTPFTHAGSYNLVKAFGYGTCAIRSNGDLYCWGTNSSGRLGNGNTIAQLSPVNIDPGLAYNDIQMGGSNSCGITTAQQVKCWGNNTYGQLGDGTIISRTLPDVGVIDGGETYSKLSAVGEQVCGITTAQKLKCWGRNQNGQLGDGTTTNQPSPVLIDGATNYADVKTIGTYTCALTTAGEVKCWGVNTSGQLGNGTTVQSLTPVVADPGTLYSKIYPQGSGVCGIVAVTGQLRCWGSLNLGNTMLGNNVTPFFLNTPFSYSNLYFAYYHVAGLTTTGALLMAGDTLNSPHNWGLQFPNTPIIQNSEKNFSMITSSCRIDSEQKLFCRGYSDGTSSSHTTFVAVDPSNNYVFVSSESGNNCAIRADGKLFCWGYNGDGQVGNGSVTPQYSPLEIDSGQTYSYVDVGPYSTCAIRSNGQLLCWGDNSEGTVGDGTIVNKLLPVEIDIGQLYEKVSVSEQACGIIRVTGVLKCWGDGFRGKVGHGSATDQLTPLTIDGGTTYKDVKAISQHTCGITTAGAMKCWGRNFNDEVGDGTGVNRNVPTAIDFATVYESIGDGEYDHTCAVTAAGGVKCWGDNFVGVSGASELTLTNVPTTVLGLPAIAKVLSGGLTSCAIDTTGKIWCWGYYNVTSEYGLGTNPSSLNQLLIRNLRAEGD